jgi:hypothetical protein
MHVDTILIMLASSAAVFGVVNAHFTSQLTISSAFAARKRKLVVFSE